MTALEMASAAEATFSQEQRDLLHHRSDEQSKTQALTLLKEIRQHQLDGTPVDDPRVQELTRSVDGIGTSVHGGDERMIAAANRLWQDNRVEISRSLDLPAPDDVPDIVDYLQRARRVRST